MIDTNIKKEMAGKKIIHYGKRLSEIRDRHFMDICRRLLSDPDKSFSSSRKLTAEAVKMPAPNFYVSYMYALRKIRLYREKGQLPRNCGIRTQKWIEIIDRMERIMARHGVNDAEALARVLEGTAPRFYITPTSALRLFYRIRHDRRRQMTKSETLNRVKQ